MRRVQFLTTEAKDNRLTRDKCFLNKLKHQEVPGMFLFLSNEKNIAQVKKLNRKKIGDGLKAPKRFLQPFQ